MDIKQKRQGFRFSSIRVILGLSIFEFSRLLNRSHHTMMGIERGIRNPTSDILIEVINLANKHEIELEEKWLMGESKARLPKSHNSEIRNKIEKEKYIEEFILNDTTDHRKEFSNRLKKLIEMMRTTNFLFSKWANVAPLTVNHWCEGKVFPKRENLRFIFEKALSNNIPISIKWLCTGKGEQKDLTKLDLSYKIDQKSLDSKVIKIKIDSFDYEPYLNRNTKLIAYPYPSNAFILNWKGFFLYNYKDHWIPVKIQSTKELNKFHIISLHNKIGNQIILKNTVCNMIYPVISIETPYPIKQNQIC